MDAKDFLDGVKAYGRIEFDDDDELLLELLEAAMETLKRAGVPKDVDSPLYRLAVKRLTLHYYENPEEVTTHAAQVPMGMSWMIEQLRNDDEAEE